ncbi:MAG: hypothetical protein ACRC28_18760 [Clostridium sp.]|uniref:hypothetical protein n=1 Tax=Clostridium sp. TaxID=1506 RepID=UPI003F30AE19
MAKKSNSNIISIEGVADTKEGIRLFKMGCQAEASKVIQKYAKAVKKKAESKAPVSNVKLIKGHYMGGRFARQSLKNSITMETFFEGMGAMIYPEKTKAPYRNLVEYGTRKGNRWQKNVPTFYRSGKTGKMVRNSSGNVGSMSGTFFMTYAKKEVDPSYNAEIRRVYNKEKKI